MSSQKDIGWMYDGVKADVHREDYLLGKTVDKNFEKYSDAIIEQKEDAVDSLTKSRIVGASTSAASTAKTSSIPIEIMKSQDPLVAIKVKEESRRRDVLENPLTKLRFQKMIKEMMDKKSKKDKKKKKKKDKKRKDSSSDDSSDSEEEHHKRNKEKKKKERKERRRSSSSEDERRKEKRGKSREEKRRRRDSSSEEEDEDRKRRERKRRNSSDEERKSRKRRGESEERRRRRDSSGEERKRRRDSGETHKDKRSYDSHIPAHLRAASPGSSEEGEEEKREMDREEREKKARWEGYGLIGGEKKKQKKDEGDEVNPYKLKRIPQVVQQERKARRPLTEEEKQRKLKEFQDNAVWRNEVRESNIKRGLKAEEEEEKEADGRPASFVRPMLNALADGHSMEDRLKTKKKQLQRGPGYMDKL